MMENPVSTLLDMSSVKHPTDAVALPVGDELVLVMVAEVVEEGEDNAR